MTLTNTIVAPATQPGTGAVSIIRISGPEALSIADSIITFKNGNASDAKGYSLKYGIVKDIDDVLVSIFRAPHSYTGEDSVEISCHASAFIVTEIIRLVCDAGAVPAEPGEFTRRAFVNGKMDLSQAEAVADVIASETAAAHRVAMNQLRGAFSSELQDLRAKLVDITSLVELELDFSEEDVEFADRSQLNSLLDEVISHIKKLTDTFRLGNAIKSGIPVAIVGATNTGKSTLLNSMLGEERAIVSSIAGTTRDTIEETFNINGTLFRLIDTAGIRETSDIVETIGIDRTFEKLMHADVVIHVLDINYPVDQMVSVAKRIRSKVVSPHQKVIFVLNKADHLLSELELAKVEASESTFADFNEVNRIVTYFNKYVLNGDNQSLIHIISAKRGLGIDELKDLIFQTQSDRLNGNGTSILVSNARHYNALCSAGRSLENVKANLTNHTATDFLAQDLREALYYLGTITGDITTDEVLGNIFKKFCIGK